MPRYYNPRSEASKKKYKDLAINNPLDNLITDRLEKTHLVILDAIENCKSSVLQQHFTLRLPENYSGTYSIEELYKRFYTQLQNLWRKKIGKDKRSRGKLHFTSCIEIETSKNEHIHFMTFVDSKINKSYGVLRLAQRAWEYALTTEINTHLPLVINEYENGLVHYSRRKESFLYDSNEKLALEIVKGDSQALNDAMYWASYLCKHRAGSPLFRFKSSQLSK